jgi:hypothetical protein
MRLFNLSQADLIEILDSYYSEQPRTDTPTETAPVHQSRTVVENDSFERDIMQLVESTDELW